MDSQANKEKKVVSTIEKVVMYFMYALFGFMNIGVILSGEFNSLFVTIPITVLSLGLTNWGMKWQNERYIRSAENQDNIDNLKKIIINLEKKITDLEEK
jgi:hypothetical protein